MKLGFVAAMQAEADVFDASVHALPGLAEMSVLCSGPGPDNAAAAARRHAAEDCDVLVSWGLAGGLSPSLAVGRLVCGSMAATAEDEERPQDAALVRLLKTRLTALAPACGTFLSAPRPLATVEEKRIAHARSGAALVDMESGAIRAIAVEHGISFVFLRTVIDSALHDLPPAALLELDARGRARTGAVAYSLIRHPLQLPALVRLARNYRCALTTLRRAARLLTEAESGTC